MVTVNRYISREEGNEKCSSDEWRGSTRSILVSARMEKFAAKGAHDHCRSRRRSSAVKTGEEPPETVYTGTGVSNSVGSTGKCCNSDAFPMQIYLPRRRRSFLFIRLRGRLIKLYKCRKIITPPPLQFPHGGLTTSLQRDVTPARIPPFSSTFTSDV